jgi:error-prone DNA polymerase
MRTLVRADAFGSLDLGRRETLWHVAGLEADELPLIGPGVIPETPEIPANWTQPSSRGGLSRRGDPEQNPHLNPGLLRYARNDCNSEPRFRDDVTLPPLRDDEAVAEDYASFGLSLKNHPLAFLRADLKAKSLITAAALKQMRDGGPVKIAGLVLFRQRPGTAKGTIFITIEDETGAANLIVWPKIAEKYRRAVFGAKLLFCQGLLQKEGNVIHVVSRHLADWTAMLQKLQSGPSRPDLHTGLASEVAHATNVTTRTRKSAGPAWTDTLKSRDFR